MYSLYIVQCRETNNIAIDFAENGGTIAIHVCLSVPAPFISMHATCALVHDKGEDVNQKTMHTLGNVVFLSQSYNLYLQPKLFVSRNWSKEIHDQFRVGYFGA